MEAMSRERKLYQSLELDEGEAHGKYRRDVRVPPRKLAQPCESLLCILPNIPYFSGRQSLQLAYDDLEERFFELEIRHSALQSSAEEAQDKAEQASDALNSKLSKLTEESTKLAQELTSAKQENSRLANEISSATLLASQLRTTIADQEQDAAKAAASLEQYTDQILDYGAKLRDSQAQGADLEARLIEVQAEHSGALDGLSSQLEAAKQEGAALRGKLKAALHDKADLSKQLEQTKDDCQAALSERDSLKRDVGSLSTEKQELEAGCAKAKDECSALWQEVQTSRAEVGKLASELKREKDSRELEAQEKSRTIQKISEVEGERCKLQVAIRKLEEDLAERDKHLQAYGSELARYQKEEAIPQEASCLDAPREKLHSGHGRAHSSTDGPSIWDSATEISPPEQPVTSTSYDQLGDKFKDRESWRQVLDEGRSAGWLLCMDEVSKQDIIGKGSFGTTYLGTYRKQKVAVKCVRIEREIEACTFLRELGALARIRHANIMTLLGAVIEPPRNCWLVVEYLPGGSLAQWLYGINNKSAQRRSMLEKVTMGLEIAKGMLALEATNPPIMHRDLKPDNILLSETGKPKIADFGLCREHLEDEAYSYTGETGSYTYMSPEMMRGEMYDTKTDIYSYAIVLTEILKQKPPFEEAYLTPMQIAEGVAYHDLRPQLPGSLPGGLKYLLEACWCPEPEVRPDFSTVVGHMADVVSSLPPTKRGFFS